MQIKFEDLKQGDEIIIPSNSNLKYLKLKHQTKKGSWACSMFNGEEYITITYSNRTYQAHKKRYLEPNLDKHNSTFYLEDNGDYVDIWLVKRE